MSCTSVTRQPLQRRLLDLPRCRTKSGIVQLGRRRYATNDNVDATGEKEDFKGQLYQSTNERVQRDRAEQARFAQIRAAQKAGRGTPAWLVPFVLSVGILGGWSLGQRHEPEPLQPDTAPMTLQAAWADIKDIVGEEHIVTDLGITSASPSSLPSDQPFAIISPGSTEEVSAVMKVCLRRRIPVTAYSDATSLEGLFDAAAGGICIDLSRLDRKHSK